MIEGDYAFFKFDKFFERLKAKDWKYKEEKTGRIMEQHTGNVSIEFLEQKDFPQKRKVNTMHQLKM